jgi:DNA polymerase V
MFKKSTNEDGVEILPAISSANLSLPLIDGLSAGFPSPARDYMEESIDLNKELIRNPNWTFIGRVKGQSMRDAGIDESDLVVIDRSLEGTHGRIALCALDGGLTIKRLHMAKDQLYLMPANPAYKPIKVTEEQNFSVWGVVTYVIKKL